MLFPNEQKKMLTELLADESDTMNKWEIEFTESLDAQFEKGYSLTGDQIRVLKKIWDKVFN